MAEADEVLRIVRATFCQRLDVVDMDGLDQSAVFATDLTERIGNQHLLTEVVPLIVVVPLIRLWLPRLLVVPLVHQPGMLVTVPTICQSVASWVSARLLR